MGEEEIKEHPTMIGYGASRDGRVWSRKKKRGLGYGKGGCWVLSDEWREIKTCPTACGHLRFTACEGSGKEKSVMAHRFVMEVFVGPCPVGTQCCHNNGNPADNRVENLRWDTQLNNIADRDRHGTTAHQKGERHGGAKLTESDVLDIRARYAAGERGISIAASYGVSKGTVSRVALRQNWAHVT